jgi:hypothetical protein
MYLGMRSAPGLNILCQRVRVFSVAVPFAAPGLYDRVENRIRDRHAMEDFIPNKVTKEPCSSVPAIKLSNHY